MNVKLKLSALALFFVMVLTACGSDGGNTTTVAATGISPQLMTIAPSGKFAYVAN